MSVNIRSVVAADIPDLLVMVDELNLHEDEPTDCGIVRIGIRELVELVLFERDVLEVRIRPLRRRCFDRTRPTVDPEDSATIRAGSASVTW